MIQLHKIQKICYAKLTKHKNIASFHQICYVQLSTYSLMEFIKNTNINNGKTKKQNIVLYNTIKLCIINVL